MRNPYRFQPYRMGPFSAEVYDDLAVLVGAGLVRAAELEEDGTVHRRRKRFTPPGHLPPVAPLIVGEPDADGDLFGDVCDCAPADGGAFATPHEIAGLRPTANKTTLEWESDAGNSGVATVYDLLRGELAAAADVVRRMIAADAADL